MHIFVSPLIRGHWERRLSTLIIYVIDHPEISLWISSIYVFIISFNKAAKFYLCCWRKTIVLKKVQISFQYSIRDFAHYKDSEWVMMVKSICIFIASDFCFTNLRICRVTQRRWRFSESDLYFIMRSRQELDLIYLKKYSCNQRKLALF